MNLANTGHIPLQWLSCFLLHKVYPEKNGNIALAIPSFEDCLPGVLHEIREAFWCSQQGCEQSK